MISLKGLTSGEVRVLARHGFRSCDIVIDCLAVEDGADRLRKFIVAPDAGGDDDGL